MASSLLALLDDVAVLLDDVAVMTKVAAKKTAGVLGDDLALNAEQVAGVKADRELAVVFAVAKGSALNKAVLVPTALGLSAAAPWAVTPLMMAGGSFLCYEGFEKVAHRFLHSPAEDAARHKELVAAVADASVDMVAFEREKIKGAVQTDFILSAELIVISLGSTAQAPFAVKAGVLAAVSVLMTVGVYGLVAGIVKLDDLGLRLAGPDGSALGIGGRLGRGILASAPALMKALSVLGTAAMFLVGGGILAHSLPGVGTLAHHAASHGGAAVALFDGLVGLAAGGVLVGLAALAR
ncbi:MAG: hypothetical protein FD126_2311, partial [Elusimicrobia bacterium]